MEHDGLRPLPTDHLQPRRAIFLVLDYPLRPRLVLSQRPPAGPNRLAGLRAAGSSGRRRISPRRHFPVEPRHSPLFFHWLLEPTRSVSTPNCPCRRPPRNNSLAICVPPDISDHNVHASVVLPPARRARSSSGCGW